MPYPYQIWLRQSCLDYLGTLKRQERLRLISWIEDLGNDVSKEGDFTLRGADDRDWQVAVLDRHAIVWWADHPVAEIKVVAIRLADR